MQLWSSGVIWVWNFDFLCLEMNCYFSLSFSENPHSSCHEGGELSSSQVLPLSGLVHPSEGWSSQADTQSVLRGRQWHLPTQPRLVSGVSVQKVACLRCLTASRYFSRLPGNKEKQVNVKERERSCCNTGITGSWAVLLSWCYFLSLPH